MDTICGRLPGGQRRAKRGGREAGGAGHGPGVVAAVVDAVEALQLHVSVSICWRLLLYVSCGTCLALRVSLLVHLQRAPRCQILPAAAVPSLQRALRVGPASVSAVPLVGAVG